MNLITLYDEEKAGERTPNLSPTLTNLYDGNLVFPQKQGPYVIGNFVQTIDGIVSFLIPGHSSGGPISGSSVEDRFVMGLLRSCVDAVLVGSGTLRGDPGHIRIPEFSNPEFKELYASLRNALGKPRLPRNVILTASGRLDLQDPTFHTEGLEVVIITTDEGAERLARDSKSSNAIVRSTSEEGGASPQAVLKILGDEFGVRLLLHEGGPTVFGEFLSAGLIDELFLTLAPQIAGREKDVSRPSFGGRTTFLPETAPWFSLSSVKKAGSHLLLRYVR